ncbi:MAG TPA: ABC transporter substrate-binding protein [bacterium]|nr:ABC transporter substrate-binding protein [bacterium]
MKRWGAAICALAIGIGLSGWQPASGQGKVQLTHGKIVLAVINDQSGVYADISGKNGVEAVKMAAEDYLKKYGQNAVGGAIEVLSADHQNKPDVGASKAAEFYDRDNANAVIDVPTSSVGIAIAHVAAQKHRVFFAVGAATTAISNEDCNKYTFHYGYDTYMLANGTATQVTQKVGKAWYIVYPNYAYGQDMNRSFSAAIAKSGGKVLLSDATPFPNETEDFSTFLIKARTMRPALQVMGAMQAGQDLVNLVKQYNEFGLRKQGINLAIGLLFDSDINSLTPAALEGTLFTTAWEWNMDKEARDWADRFFARTKVRPSFPMAGDYSAAWQYLDAVRRAGTDDPDKVVAQLEAYKFNDFFARHAEIRKQDHVLLHDAYLAQVKAPGDVKEPWDYVKILQTIPASQAFQPLSQNHCTMAR